MPLVVLVGHKVMPIVLPRVLNFKASEQLAILLIWPENWHKAKKLKKLKKKKGRKKREEEKKVEGRKPESWKITTGVFF